MKQCKRLMALVLLAACAVTAVSGCFGEAREDAEPFVPKALRYVAAPEEAFQGAGDIKVIAVAEEGNKLLISGRNSLYLWDVNAGRRMPVYFSREEDIEMLNTAVPEQFRSEKYSEQMLEMYRRKMQEYLAEYKLTRFENLDQACDFCEQMGKRFDVQCMSVGDHYAVMLLYRPGLYFTVSLLTGEAVIFEDAGVEMQEKATWAGKQGLSFYPVLCGDLLLSDNGITDLNTGETLRPEIVNPDTLPDDIPAGITARAALLRDGSVLQVFQSNIVRKEKGYSRDGYLVDRRADGTTATLVYGDSETAPVYVIATGNGRYAAVYDLTGMWTGIWIMDRDTGEVRSLDDFNRLIIGAYDTGFLCYDLNDPVRPVLAMDAETLDCAFVSLTGENCPLRLLAGMFSNGRYYCPRSDVINGWFIAE